MAHNNIANERNRRSFLFIAALLTCAFCQQTAIAQVDEEFIYTPDSFIHFRGSMVGTLEDLSFSDDQHLLNYPGFVLNACEYQLAIIYDFTLATDLPIELSFETEVHANTPGLQQKYHFFNWTTGTWDDNSNPCLCCGGPFEDVPFLNDTVTTIDLSDRLPDIVEPGTGRVRVATGYYQVGFILVFPWEISLDHVFVTTVE